MKQFTASENDNGTRMSRFVQRVTTGLPDAAMYKAFRNRRIKINGKRAAPDARLRTGDVVQLYLNDEYFHRGAGHARPAVQGPLPACHIVYQNDALAVLYKPAGVLSHRGANGGASLLDAFTQQLIETGEYRPQAENAFAPALCNRLDRGTEGLVLAAKQAAALRDINEIIRLGAVEKSYLCVCVGAPPVGVHHAWHRRNRAAKTAEVTAQPLAGTKAIATEVAAVEAAGPLSLCRVVLHTGRTHQIRAHLALLGAPILGDGKYGDTAANRRFALPHQALCAWQLAFAPQLPQSSVSTALAGRVFRAEEAALPGWWQAYLAGP